MTLLLTGFYGETLINWDNVQFARRTEPRNNENDGKTIIFMVGKEHNSIIVEETIEEIRVILSGTKTIFKVVCR